MEKNTKKQNSTETQMGYDTVLCSVNPQCFNCLHFWNTGDTPQKGKCTHPNSPDYREEVEYLNVCDYFEAV
jgi:hypothetical protein